MTAETYIEGQTCVVCTTDMYKRASLLFDRVNARRDVTHEYGPPEGIRFEIPAYEEIIKERLTPLVDDFLNTLKDGVTDADFVDCTMWKVVRLAANVYNEKGVPVVPMFSSNTTFLCAFQEGRERVFRAAWESLSLPSEDGLEWDQILSFRKDKDSVRKYRGLRIWLRDLSTGESVGEIRERIEQALDEYEGALRKHGILTVTGVLSELLRWDTLVGVATTGGVATCLAGPVTGLVASGAIFLGKVSLSMAEQQLALEDLHRGETAAVALIYDVRKQFGKKAEGS